MSESFDCDLNISYTDRKYHVVAALPDDAERATLSYEHPTFERALREIGHGVDVVAHHGGVHTDANERGEWATDALTDVPGVVDAHYHSPVRELHVTQTTQQTDHYMDNIGYAAALEEDWFKLDFHREHGVVLEFEYRVRPFAPPRTDDFWQEMATRAQSKDLYERSTFANLVARYDEYTGDTEVICNDAIHDGDPRLAGTNALAYHIYYLVEEQEYSPAEAVETAYPRLDAEDAQVALAYAQEHEAEANAYCQEMVERNKKLREEFDLDDTTE